LINRYASELVKLDSQNNAYYPTPLTLVVENGTYSEGVTTVEARIFTIRGTLSSSTKISNTFVMFNITSQSYILSVTTGSLTVENIWFIINATSSTAVFGLVFFFFFFMCFYFNLVVDRKWNNNSL
jgi:hypothetical protein